MSSESIYVRPMHEGDIQSCWEFFSSSTGSKCFGEETPKTLEETADKVRTWIRCSTGFVVMSNPGESLRPFKGIIIVEEKVKSAGWKPMWSRYVKQEVFPKL